MKYSEFEMLDATENNTIEEIDDLEVMENRLSSREQDEIDLAKSKLNYQMQYVQ